MSLDCILVLHFVAIALHQPDQCEVTRSYGIYTGTADKFTIVKSSASSAAATEPSHCWLQIGRSIHVPDLSSEECDGSSWAEYVN